MQPPSFFVSYLLRCFTGRKGDSLVLMMLRQVPGTEWLAFEENCATAFPTKALDPSCRYRE